MSVYTEWQLGFDHVSPKKNKAPHIVEFEEKDPILRFLRDLEGVRASPVRVIFVDQDVRAFSTRIGMPYIEVLYGRDGRNTRNPETGVISESLIIKPSIRQDGSVDSYTFLKCDDHPDKNSPKNECGYYNYGDRSARDCFDKIGQWLEGVSGKNYDLFSRVLN